MNENPEQKCYSCGGGDFEIIHRGTRDNANLDVLKCKNCGLLFLSDDSHIDSTFYEQGGMLGGKFNLQNWINNTFEDDKRRFLMLKKDLKNKVLTDFGCGNAGFLNLAKNTAKKVYGVELQKDLYEYFDKCNLEVYADIAAIPEKSDIITMFHVLEHIKNPVQILKNLKPHLNQGGKIIIEVPNSKDALIRLYNCKSFQDFVYWSCHIYVYNEKTLKKIVQDAGYKIEKFRQIQRYSLINHLFWLFKHKPGGHKKWAKFDLKPLNWVYSFILKLFKMTDTLMIEISK